MDRCIIFPALLAIAFSYSQSVFGQQKRESCFEGVISGCESIEVKSYAENISVMELIPVVRYRLVKPLTDPVLVTINMNTRHPTTNAETNNPVNFVVEPGKPGVWLEKRFKKITTKSTPNKSYLSCPVNQITVNKNFFPRDIKIGIRKNTFEEGEPVLLQVGGSRLSEYSWNWKIRSTSGNTSNQQGTSIVVKSLPPGDYEISLQGINNIMGYKLPDIKTQKIKVSELMLHPPANFSIRCSSGEIFKSQEVTLSVAHNEIINGQIAEWIWFANDKQLQEEGTVLRHKPNTSTTYKVMALVKNGFTERKFSIGNVVTVRVKPIPTAPKIMKLESDITQNRIIEGQRIRLDITGDKSDPNAGKEFYRWRNITTNMDLPEKGSSIEVAPTETSEYEVRSVLRSGKNLELEDISEAHRIRVFVQARYRQPRITSDTVFCRHHGELPKNLKLTFRDGVPGGESSGWNLYEGIYGESFRKLGFTKSNSFSDIPFPTVTTRYFITPDRDFEKYTPVIINILEADRLEQLVLRIDKTILCPQDTLTLSLLPPGLPEGTMISWWKDSRVMIDQGNLFQRFPPVSGSYSAQVINLQCKINKKLSPVKVMVRENDRNYYRDRVTISGPKYGDGLNRYIAFSFKSNVADDNREEIRYEWHLNSDSAIIYTDREFIIKNRKAKSVQLLAINPCGNLEVLNSNLDWKSTVRKYRFINAGILTGQDRQPLFRNLMLSGGGDWFYVRAKFNLNTLMFKNPSFESDNSRILDYPINSETYYRFSNFMETRRNALVAGILFPGNVLKPYVGAGYGLRSTIWSADIFEYYSNRLVKSGLVKNNALSCRGLELECGLFFDLKRKLNIISGVNCIFDNQNKSTYFDGQIGLGINL